MWDLYRPIDNGGIFRGMKSNPNPDEVLAALGDKVVSALAEAVVQTRTDLDEYRENLPRFVTEHSPRGLANWIHDRLFHHVAKALDETPGVFIRDAGPIRKVSCGVNYLIRLKRHDPLGAIASYPTEMALEFQGQADDDLVLEGLAELHLMAGYIWLEESREIGPAVLSYRIGKKIGWIRLLEELRGDEFGFDFGGGTFPIAPPSGLPSLPTIAITITIDEEDSSASDGGL